MTRVNLGALTKFSGQLIAALIIILVGHVSIDSIMLGERVSSPATHWLGSSVLTLFFLLRASLNAHQSLRDKLGWGSGFGGKHDTPMLCGVGSAGGQLAGALRRNHRRRVDGRHTGIPAFQYPPGAHIHGRCRQPWFLGFFGPVWLSILLTKQAATPLSTALPLLLIGLPVLDTLTVMVARLYAGRSPFSADRRHFHHRLLDLGFDNYEVVMPLSSTSCNACCCCWPWQLLLRRTDLLIVASFVAFAVLFTGAFVFLERVGWRWRAPGTGSQRSVLGHLRAWLRAMERFTRWSMRIMLGLLRRGVSIGRRRAVCTTDHPGYRLVECRVSGTALARRARTSLVLCRHLAGARSARSTSQSSWRSTMDPGGTSFRTLRYMARAV